MSNDTDQAIRRVESSRQTEMFGAGAPSTPRSYVGEKGFVDPDPEQLVYGAYTLREFLSRTGQDTPLLVRDVIRSIDFGEFEAGYELTGRAPYHPAIMLGLLVYGIMQGQSTLRDLEALAVRDLGAHWITGGVFPDHSTLGKFIQRHAALITVDFFEALTTEVLERIGNVSQVWSGDGTVIQSAANRFRTLQLDVARELADEMRTQRERCDDDDSSGGDAGCGEDAENVRVRRSTRKTLDLERLELAIEVGEKRAERRRHQGADPAKTQICTTDPEAGILKYKNSGRIGPGWVPSILTTSRIIIAAITHGYSETQVLGRMFDQAKRVTGATTAAVLMDTNYHSFAAVDEADRRNLLLLSPGSGQTGPPKKRKFYNKHSDFRWVPGEDVYECPAGNLLRFSHINRDRRRGSARRIYRPSISDCSNCDLKPECTTADRRQVSRDIDEQKLEAVRNLMADDFVRELYGHRQGDVEPVYAEIKGAQGLTRFRRTGSEGVKVEFTLHACAHNLRRLVTVLRRRAGGPLQAAFALLTMILRLLDALCGSYRHSSGNTANCHTFSCAVHHGDSFSFYVGSRSPI